MQVRQHRAKRGLKHHIQLRGRVAGVGATVARATRPPSLKACKDNVRALVIPALVNSRGNALYTNRNAHLLVKVAYRPSTCSVYGSFWQDGVFTAGRHGCYWVDGFLYGRHSFWYR